MTYTYNRTAGFFDNRAYQVVHPFTAYENLGWTDGNDGNTYVGSSQMLPTVWKEIRVNVGDLMVDIPGGSFLVRKHSNVGVPVVTKVSDKHPFEKSYGGRPLFSRLWPMNFMEEVPYPDSVRYEVRNKKVELPPGAKRHERNIDYIV